MRRVAQKLVQRELHRVAIVVLAHFEPPVSIGRQQIVWLPRPSLCRPVIRASLNDARDEWQFVARTEVGDREARCVFNGNLPALRWLHQCGGV